MTTLNNSGYKSEGVYGELPTSPCVFAACDSAYFMRHAGAFVYSANKAGKPVHIHIINPTKDTFSLAGILNATTEVSVTYTFNTASLPKDKKQTRALYACLRFLILPHIIRSAKKVLVLDIDCMIMMPFDFPDKSCGYFPRKSNKESLRVAAGAVYLTNKSLEVSKKIVSTIKKLPLKWYVDQVSLSRVFRDIPKDQTALFDRRFMDWGFKRGSIIWTGKGDRKYSNKTYVTTKKKMGNIKNKLKQYKNVILKPRLDLPFKESGLKKRGRITEPIRKHWSNFVEKLKSKVGQALVIEMPRWMFNESLLKLLPENINLYVPHEERKYWGGNDNTRFYMQTVFPWLFTIDKNGWGGAAEFTSSFNPLEECFDDVFFNRLLSYAKKGGTKFKNLQPKKNVLKKHKLISPFIFVPLQIPHDVVIMRHSDITCEQFVKSLCEWSSQEGNPQVVFKGHPINKRSMAPLRKIIGRYKNTMYIEDCHIHYMMKLSSAVYVINSGTGQEAMLFDKPIAAFGGSEYIDAVVKGDIKNLDETWEKINSINTEDMKSMYRRWYSWYEKNVFDTSLTRKN